MRRSKKSIFRIVFLIFILSVIAIYGGSLKMVGVVNKTIEIKGLDKALDGVKILQISDLHSNNPEKMNLNIWRTIDKLDFDLVVITGDFVDRNAYQAEPHMDGLTALAAKKTVFFAEGNHDHYSMGKLRHYLESAGVTVLIDEKTDYRINGADIEVVGLQDFYTCDLEESAGFFTKSDKFRLVLMHQPQHVDYVDLNASPCLAISGHTHGGQIRLPFFPTIYAPGQGFFPNYGEGVYDIGDARLFVSKGLGYTGKAPLRFWNRPELCVLTLKAV